MNAAIILAAGSSSRFGRPKQNLYYHNKTFLQKTIDTALDSDCHPVVVVLGAHAQQIESKVYHRLVHIVYNQNWAEGMASSISTGIRELDKFPETDNALILVCDQPYVSQELIGNIIKKKHETARSIIACAYGDTLGVPVLFDKIMFGELLSLNGNEGAKTILKKYPQEITAIPFKQGIIDVDTPEDYDRLLSSRH